LSQRKSWCGTFAGQNFALEKHIHNIMISMVGNLK